MQAYLCLIKAHVGFFEIICWCVRVSEIKPIFEDVIMRIKQKHTEPEALNQPDELSAARELYIGNKKLVELTVEMDKEEAWEVFNALPEHILPPLPHGYQWAHAKDNYSIICNALSPKHNISLILYGPDATQGHINFLCQVDGVTTYSFAHTKPSNEIDRKYPMKEGDYRVPGYNYTNKKYKRHVQGHLIDHIDTIHQGSNSSTYDARNYVPEPPQYEWGLGYRRCKVGVLRKQPGGGAYAQYNVYPEHPIKTADGTPVPEDVRFYAYSNDYVAQADIVHVKFEEEMQRKKGVKVLEHAEQFKSSLAAAPVVQTYEAEMSDRDLRREGRKTWKKISQIDEGDIFSRFKNKDRMLFSCVAGDLEFEASSRQLRTGISAEADETTRNSFLARSLHLAKKLCDLDGGSPFNKKDKKLARTFFKGQKSAEMQKLEDDFRQCSTDDGTSPSLGVY